jgi:hypothetical protein
LLPNADAVGWARGALPDTPVRLWRRIPRAYLPAVALAIAALVAVSAWQLAPTRDADARHVVVAADEQPAFGVGGAVGAGGGAEPGQAPAPDAGGTSARPARVAPADTTGPFPSGVAAGNMTEVRAWEAYRGRTVDVVVTYSDRSSWRSIINPWIGSGPERFSAFRGDWVISQPLFPDSGPEKGNLTDCAAGAYNAKWHAFGRWLVAQGRGDSFIRLAWEFNGLWFAWAATNPTQWIQCFRNVSSSIKAESPKVRIDWTMNAHGSTTPVGAFALYPGDAYVDVVGIDSYDMYPPSRDAATFDRQCYGEVGLCQAIAFARLHNKLFSVSRVGRRRAVRHPGRVGRPGRRRQPGVHREDAPDIHAQRRHIGVRSVLQRRPPGERAFIPGQPESAPPGLPRPYNRLW